MTDPVGPSTPPPPPGWYTQGGRQRWWDGAGWGDFHVPYHKSTNHVFHLLMTIITVGLWIPVWIIVSISNRPPK